MLSCASWKPSSDSEGSKKSEVSVQITLCDTFNRLECLINALTGIVGPGTQVNNKAAPQALSPGRRFRSRIVIQRELLVTPFTSRAVSL
jgi:hypothetical protein